MTCEFFGCTFPVRPHACPPKNSLPSLKSSGQFQAASILDDHVPESLIRLHVDVERQCFEIPHDVLTPLGRLRTLVNSKSGLRYADIADTSVDMKRKRSTEKEAQILRSLPPSQFVIAYYADYCEGDIFYLVMELCSCSFLHALDKTPQLTESTLQRVFTGMLWGLVAIHAARVVHRDVKAGCANRERLAEYSSSAGVRPKRAR